MKKELLLDCSLMENLLRREGFEIRICSFPVFRFCRFEYKLQKKWKILRKSFDICGYRAKVTNC